MRARRVFCLLLAVILLAALLPQALAAGLIETDRPVTLTVRFFHDKVPVSGAPFSLYRVADVSAYGEFTLTGDFKDDPVRLDDRSSDGWRALAETLRAKGVETVSMDLARCDMAEAVAQAFRFSKLVLATPTYNADVFPFMKDFINHLTERNYQNRTVAFIENGSWAPMAAKVMRKMLENSKALTFADTTVTVKGALNDASEAQIAALADELSK